MIDLRDVDALYSQATADWVNSRWSKCYPLVTLANYKRLAAMVPDMVDEIKSLRERVKELESNGN